MLELVVLYFSKKGGQCMKDIVKVQHLSKSYDQIEALKDMSFEVNGGEVFGILGPNGAGKSTCIETMLGVSKADYGEVSIMGLNPIKERKTLFEMVGVQFQETKYQENVKVYELCQMTHALYKKPKDWQQLLNDFYMDTHKNQYVKDLSGGQKQRLALVLALIPNPKVVFLDELTTGLDPKVRKDVWKLLLKLKKEGLTIILTSHFMEEVDLLCDRISILNHGEVVFMGTVDAAKQQAKKKTLEDAYLWFTGEEDLNESI